MKRLTRILKLGSVAFFAIVIVVGIVLSFSGPRLPDDTDSTIDSVMQLELPELLQGEIGFVHSGETKIWYESIRPTDLSKGTILLFMGISNDALGWPQDFISPLVDAGYQVIRYDYRGTGLSDWIDDWKQKPYSLADLANDAVIILDNESIEQAHIVGISMGGMVAQEFAINHPDRLLTLTLMMSSGDIVDVNLPPISQSVTFDLITVAMKYGILPTERNTIKLHIAARLILQGDAEYDIDVREIAKQVLYNFRNRNGYNPKASQQHQEAVFRSGSRFHELRKIDVPSLVIHGLNDPFIPIEHSEKLAATIPNSRTQWFENMGHDIPPYLIDTIITELILNFENNLD